MTKLEFRLTDDDKPRVTHKYLAEVSDTEIDNIKYGLQEAQSADDIIDLLRGIDAKRIDSIFNEMANAAEEMGNPVLEFTDTDECPTIRVMVPASDYVKLTDAAKAGNKTSKEVLEAWSFLVMPNYIVEDMKELAQDIEDSEGERTRHEVAKAVQKSLNAKPNMGWLDRMLDPEYRNALVVPRNSAK